MLHRPLRLRLLKLPVNFPFQGEETFFHGCPYLLGGYRDVPLQSRLRYMGDVRVGPLTDLQV